MTTFDNGAPRDGWQVDPHACPFEDATCPICKGRLATEYRIESHIELGAE